MNLPVAPPTAPSAGQRLRLYLYSNRHLAGCALALVGLALLFAGVIERGWPLIVLGLYAVGALAWPRDRLGARVAEAELPAEALIEHLDRLIGEVAKRVPAEALASLRSIQQTLAELLPRLRELRGSGALSAPAAFAVQETLRRYLPDMLGGYLKLPPVFACTQPLKDGRTAAQTLSQQLELLDQSLQRISLEAFAGDAESLLLSERFLKEKFDAAAAFELA